MDENGNGHNGANGTLASNRKLMADFIAKFRDCGNVRLACEAAGVPRRTAYNWRERWATFRDEWDEAEEDAVDKLDAEAWKRAIKGSDRLLMFLLQAHRRDVYNVPQRQEFSGPDGGPVETTVRVNVGQLTDSELTALAEIAGRIGNDTAGADEA